MQMSQHILPDPAWIFGSKYSVSPPEQEVSFLQSLLILFPVFPTLYQSRTNKAVSFLFCHNFRNLLPSVIKFHLFFFLFHLFRKNRKRCVRHSISKGVQYLFPKKYQNSDTPDKCLPDTPLPGFSYILYFHLPLHPVHNFRKLKFHLPVLYSRCKFSAVG